jgi:DNA-binding PadR family transcriptional regulator
MERKGLLEEEWGVTETNREAKFYRLTREGKKQLKTDVVRWKAYAQVMSRALAAAQP